MNKKDFFVILIIIVVLVISLGLASCSKQAPVLEKGSVRMGAIHALSGNNATYGEAMKKGMDLAVKEFNEQGGFGGWKLEVIYEDHAADPVKGISAFGNLRVRGVKIISTSFSNIVLSLAPLAKESNILLINSAATSKDIKKQGKFILSTIPDAEFEVGPLAEYAFKQAYRKAAVVYVDYQFGVDQKNIFKSNFESLGGKIIIEEGSPIDSKDFRDVITKIKQKQPDVIFIGTLAKEMTLIITQIREMGIEIPLITTQTCVSIESLQKIGDLVEGLIIDGPRFDLEKNTNPEFVGFRQLFQKEYGHEPDSFAMNYYDSTRMIIDGIKYCGSTKDTGCVSGYIMGLKDFEGALGLTTFKGTTVEKLIDVKVFRDGKIETLVFN